MEAAIEYHPESFGTVVMLYVNCIVNGTFTIKLLFSLTECLQAFSFFFMQVILLKPSLILVWFFDWLAASIYILHVFLSIGAQTTIMSSACALKCDIFRLVDKRWAGIAKGVGIQRIVGRIHMVQVIYKYLKLNLAIYLNILN